MTFGGFDDRSVIDERHGLMTVIFHPAKGGDVRQEWPRMILGETGNPEYACLGDLDGDGASDFITVEGDDLRRGLKTGVRIFRSPGKARAREATAWKDAGYIPGTEDNQFLYAECHDVNGDGALDLAVGGRRHPITKNTPVSAGCARPRTRRRAATSRSGQDISSTRTRPAVTDLSSRTSTAMAGWTLLVP